MALITCPECGREVSDQASACPQCGYPIKASRDFWRVQAFFPKAHVNIDKVARNESSLAKVKFIVRENSIVTENLYPKTIAEEIAKTVCPPGSKNCSAQLIPPDPDEPLPEISDAPRCPKCGSYALKTEKQGFDFGKAAFGTVLFGPVIGGSAGLIGSGDSVTVCSNCGHKF